MNGTDSAMHEEMEPMETPPPAHMPEPSSFAPVAHAGVALPIESSSPMTPVEASAEDMVAPERETGFGGHRRERRERSRGRERGGESREASGAPDMNTEDLIATSRKLTEDLLRAMGFEPKVTVRAEGNRVDVTVEVEQDDAIDSDFSSVQFELGSSYLVAAGDGTVRGCGLSGADTPELRAVYDAAFGG